MNNIDLEQIINKIVKMYPDKYTNLEKLYLNLVDLKNLKNEYTPDILREILEYYNYYSKDESVYEYFINILENDNKINRNIIEVGGGIIPSLAKKISLRQTHGSITVYDPNISNFIKPSNKLILKKELFTKEIDISNSNLIIGFMPCEATEEIFYSVEKYKKDFVIQMCEGGPHGDEFDYFEDEEEWLYSMIYTAKKIVKDNNLGKLNIIEVPKKYGIKYPILQNTR